MHCHLSRRFRPGADALEATVEIAGSGSSRTIPFANLHRKPDDTPDQETSLRPGEIITSFLIPAADFKIELGKRTLIRALQQARHGPGVRFI
jgi:FAD binding domain in molybdopterin dehydrogenase